MHFSSHSISLAILLALLIGHASVAVHAATHTPVDAAECDLCIAYSDSPDALDANQGHGVPPVLDTHVFPPRVVWQTPRRITAFHQRGPPSIH